MITPSTFKGSNAIDDVKRFCEVSQYAAPDSEEYMLGMMLAVYISLDWDVARLDGVSAPDAYLALAGMVLSVYVQRRTAKNEREVLDDEELYDF